MVTLPFFRFIQPRGFRSGSIPGEGKMLNKTYLESVKKLHFQIQRAITVKGLKAIAL
jgi:hypothetical protein